VAWTVEVSDEFAEWYRELTDDEHESVNFSVDLLEELGPSLGRPHVDSVPVLYRFQGPPDGYYPSAGLVRDRKGKLYGTTASGGAFGNGTVFTLKP